MDWNSLLGVYIQISLVGVRLQRIIHNLHVLIDLLLLGNEVLKFQQIGVGLLNVSTEVATQPVEEKAPSATTQ